MTATRNEWLKGFDRKYLTFLVPSGKEVTIRNLSDAERAYLESYACDNSGAFVRDLVLTNRAMYMCYCMVDAETKDLLFEEGDAKQLSQSMASSDARVIFDQIMEHIGVESDFEEQLKNSTATQEG